MFSVVSIASTGYKYFFTDLGFVQYYSAVVMQDKHSNQNRCREGVAKGTGTVFHMRKLEERGLFSLDIW